MVEQTILQNELIIKFALPFLLIFFIIFAILEKTKIFGDDKKQINALIAFVIGLIFVAVTFPKIIVSNMILFLTVAIVIMFVGLLLWGFVTGGDAAIGNAKWIRWVAAIVIIVAVVIAVFWAAGIDSQVFNLLFYQPWSKTLWTNVSFIAVIGIALALAMRKWE